MPTKGTQPRGFRIPPDVWADLREMAQERDESASALVVRILTRAVMEWRARSGR